VPRLRSPALVLRRWPFSETSLTLRVLTPEEGTISLLAKGVNRVGSGSFAVLDTWALVEIEYGGRPEAELLTLYSARLLDRNAGLERDPERLAAAGVLAEIAEDAAPVGQRAPEVFAWLRDALAALAAQPVAQDPATVLVPALLRGLHWFGLAPMLDAPAPAPGDRCWFSPEAGGVVHAPRRPHEHARLLHSGTLALLRRLAATRVPAPVRADAPPPASEPWDESLTILVEFLHYHAERAPRAWPLLQERRRRRKRTA
jgi:DNA repair protein RecO